MPFLFVSIRQLADSLASFTAIVTDNQRSAELTPKPCHLLILPRFNQGV
jgi:hypothetical protein